MLFGVDVMLSGEAISVISSLLLALSAAIGILFWQVIKANSDRVSDLKNARDRYYVLAERAVLALEQFGRAAEPSPGVRPGSHDHRPGSPMRGAPPAPSDDSDPAAGLVRRLVSSLKVLGVSDAAGRPSVA